MHRFSASVFLVASLQLFLPFRPASAAVGFTGRLSLSTDSAGQEFLQVNLGEIPGTIEALEKIRDSETRYNAILETDWDFTLSDEHRVLLGNSFRYGSALVRDRIELGYRYRSPGGTRLDLDSETDLEEGKIFDRDESDVRQTFIGRWNRPVGGSGNRIEVYGRAEVRRVSGDTLFFPQSHNLGKARVTWFKDVGLLGSFDIGYSLFGVAVVDSAPGSYVEHEMTSALDVYSGTSVHVSAHAMGTRRVYVNSDNSAATGWGLLSRGSFRYSPMLALDLEGRPSFELARYDRPDFIYFDYHRLGLDLGLKIRPVDEIGVEAFPGVEFLRAPDSDREDYDQVHVSFGADVIATGIWLDASYKVGRRDYASPAPRDELESVPRSDYTFGDLLFLAEKSLWGPFSFRLTASHNVEWHELREDDVTVFLLSSEVSYRF